jgi:hypothetical protein
MCSAVFGGTVSPNPPGTTNCTVTEVAGGALIECNDGTSAFVTDGSNGAAGVDGTSCTVQEVTGGVLIKCPDGSSAFIPTGGGGTNPPPATGWGLYEMPFPEQSVVGNTVYYDQQANVYRLNPSGLFQLPLNHQETFTGPDGNAETYVAVDQDGLCNGVLNLVAPELLGAAVSALPSQAAQFHWYGTFEPISYVNAPGPCAVAFLAVNSVSISLGGSQPMSGTIEGEDDNVDERQHNNRGFVSEDVLEQIRERKRVLIEQSTEIFLREVIKLSL